MASKKIPVKTKKVPPREVPRPAGRITIRDVATTAGVSATTVSRVINDSAAVRPGVRDHVQSTMNRLGYLPNAQAQSMRGQGTMTVSCIVPHIAVPAFSETFVAVDDRLRARGYTLQVVASHGSQAREKELVELSQRFRLDGVIAALGYDDDPAVHGAIAKVMCPIVLIDRDAPKNLDSVRIDHFQGVYRATEYLLRLGHRAIGLITGSDHAWNSRERRRAFRQAHADLGVPFDPRWVVDRWLESDQTYRTARQMLSASTRPTAMMAGSFLAIEVLRAAQSSRLSIPDDLSLIVFGDTTMAELATPQITVVRWDSRLAGELAADMLLGRMSSATTGDPSHVSLPSELVVRASCSAPPR